MAIAREMCSQFGFADAFVSKGAFDGESQVGTSHLEIYQRGALHSEAGNDNRPDPAFAVFLRQIENEPQLFSRNLHRAFRSASCALRRVAKRGGSKKDGGE